MLKLLKRYWDILGGTAMGLGLSFATQWQLNKMQLACTTIMLILVSIGLLKVIKSSFDNKGLIDKVVERQSPVRAVIMAQNPTQEGEELGEYRRKTIMPTHYKNQVYNGVVIRTYDAKLDGATAVASDIAEGKTTFINSQIIDSTGYLVYLN